MKKICRSNKLLALLLACLFLLACSSPEEKKAKFFNKAKGFYTEEKYRKARVELKNALQIDPKFAEGYYWLAKVEMRLTNARGAFNNLKKAVELNPSLYDAQLDLGKIFLLAGKPDDALQKADLVLAKTPKNIDAQLLKTRVLASRKDWEGAQKIIRAVIGANPGHTEAYLLGSAFLAAQKDLKGAEDLLHAGLKEAPKNAALYHALAQLYMVQKRFPDAENMYKQVAALEPKEPRHHEALVKLYLWQNNLERAESELRAMAAIDPSKEENVIPLARFLGARKRFAEAEDLLKKVVQKNSSAYKARFALADLYAMYGHTDKTLAVLEETVKQDPKAQYALRAKNYMADVYMRRGKPDKALELTSEILKDSPSDVTALLTQGRIYLDKKDAVNAVSTLKSLVKEAPKNPESHLLLGLAHRLNKAYGLAEEEFKKALGLNEKYIPASDALGELYAERKDYSHAEQTYQTLVSQAPKDPRWPFKLGLIYKLQGDSGKALSFYDKAMRVNADFLPPVIETVQMLLEKKEPQKALALIQRQVNASPKNAVLRDLAGDVAMANKNLNLAESSYEKAIELQPDRLVPNHKLASLLTFEKQAGRAIAVLQKADKLRPNNEQTSFLLAGAYDQNGEPEKAKNIYEQLIKKNPNNPVVTNNLAYIYADLYPTKDNLARALQLVQTPLAKNPGHPGLLDTLGWIYFKQGKISEAEKELQKALTKVPREALINYHLAMVLAQKGDKDGSQRALKIALAGGPFQGRDKAVAMLKSK